jgi:SAM-dependent methyltransferase
MNLKISNPENKYYKLAINKEIAIENRHGNEILDYSNSWSINPKILKYYNEDFLNIKDDTEFGWFNYLYENFSSVDTALSLGGGTGRHEMALLKAGFVKKWQSIDLVVDRGETFHYGGKKVNSLQGDLNFIELPKNKYPLIFCRGFLHHIVNLEHLIWQVNKALTNDGLFIVTEYIGEKKWQFSDRKRKFIKQKLKNKYNDIYPGNILQFRSISEMNRQRPTEAIRSNEILPILHSTFNGNIVKEYIGSYFIYPTINLLHKDFKSFLRKMNLIDDFMDYLVFVEKTINKNIFYPSRLVGIYRKSVKTEICKTDLWSDKEIKKNLYAPKRLKDYIPQNLKDYYKKLF